MKIGIPVSFGKTTLFLNTAYIDYITGAGHFPVAIYPGTAETIDMSIDMIDALLLPGGIDLDPIYYEEDNNTSMSVDPVKDAFERELYYAALERDMPVFGICRGFQLIAREYLVDNPEMKNFLTFIQNINSHNQMSDNDMGRTMPQHFVSHIPELLFGEGGNAPANLAVNSMHHQCLIANFVEKDVIGGNGFRMVAWTKRGLKKDDAAPFRFVCEAFRLYGNGKKVLAVQWHPEELKDFRLLNNFLNGELGNFEIEAIGAF